jgi:hypothetical protein
MGLEHFSEKLIQSRLTQNPNYVKIRAKLAIKRLICNITKLSRQNRLEVNYLEMGLAFNIDRWVMLGAYLAHPILNLCEGSCIPTSDHALTSRLGLRVKDSFIRGFSYDRAFTAASSEAKLFYQIGRYIYNLFVGYANPKPNLPLDISEYIEQQWKDIYVKYVKNQAK